MPDACPAGPVGTIPVGGVAAARDAIIPGMHSADICCSLMATVFDDVSPKQVMESHRAITLPGALAEAIDALPFDGLREVAHSHMGTQGDGNHFLYVGTLESTGQTVMVTHHGSRGFGARVFKVGMKLAQKWRDKLSPSTTNSNAWIPFDTEDGQQYWDTLQVVREWTKHNHSCLHELTTDGIGAKVADRFWNEHNFVFREEVDDGNVFWHAKGATPIHNDFMPDTNGVQIVPLNMAEPVLFIKGERNETNRGFAPHGAGRNMSRTQHKKRQSGRTKTEIFDISELPSAYKKAAGVISDMNKFDLATVVDRVLPYGSIMAGDWERNAPWREKKRKRNAARRNEREEKQRYRR